MSTYPVADYPNSRTFNFCLNPAFTYLSDNWHVHPIEVSFRTSPVSVQ